MFIYSLKKTYLCSMKRDESWNKKYKELWQFVTDHRRGPTRHHLEEKRMLNWLKYNRKLLNKDELSPEKKLLIERLKALISSFNRVNQYQ